MLAIYLLRLRVHDADRPRTRNNERTSSLLLSHHGELDIHFASGAALDEYVAGMHREGYVPAGEELDSE